QSFPVFAHFAHRFLHDLMLVAGWQSTQSVCGSGMVPLNSVIWAADIDHTGYSGRSVFEGASCRNRLADSHSWQR
ncbi:MAG TPA: hypothetical protein VLM40_18540, partial [Gemmata sp.]|nr:hypothetical protein [Gemmata sp.]